MATQSLQTTELKGYTELLTDLKKRIQTAQVKANLAVNKEMIRLYWDIGHQVAQRQKAADWGDQVLEVLSQDLRSAFPGVRGFSRRNVYDMVRFAKAYPEFVRQAVAQIPWGHNLLIMNKIRDSAERQWYAQKTIEHGWSRSILQMQIENNLYHRQGKALSNFDQTLPPIQSDMVRQALKDPYVFDFIALRDDYVEREVEDGLMDHVQKMLLEMGSGFALVGRQYHLEVEGDDYYVDLLFYHTRLHCYCVVELKATDFKPEYVGKLNFYISAIDDTVRSAEDKPTIGILLCKGKGPVKVEYALRGMSQPIGVSDYQVKIVEELGKSLPSESEIAARLSGHHALD